MGLLPCFERWKPSAALPTRDQQNLTITPVGSYLQSRLHRITPGCTVSHSVNTAGELPMPKLFGMTIEVEEIAVGRVMRLLNATPGVAKFHLDMDREKKPVGRPNGHSAPRKSFEQNG